MELSRDTVPEAVRAASVVEPAAAGSYRVASHKGGSGLLGASEQKDMAMT